jgi:hypothetical protein
LEFTIEFRLSPTESGDTFHDSGDAFHKLGDALHESGGGFDEVGGVPTKFDEVLS